MKQISCIFQDSKGLFFKDSFILLFLNNNATNVKIYIRVDS